MSIQFFHSKLASWNESDSLFEALRQMTKIQDLRGVMLSEETIGGGWYPWMDESEHHRAAVAEA